MSRTLLLAALCLVVGCQGEPFAGFLAEREPVARAFCSKAGGKLASYDFTQPLTSSPRNSAFQKACQPLGGTSRCWTDLPNAVDTGVVCQAVKFDDSTGETIVTPVVVDCSISLVFVCDEDDGTVQQQDASSEAYLTKIDGTFYTYHYGDSDADTPTDYNGAVEMCASDFGGGGKLAGTGDVSALAQLCNAGAPDATSRRCWLPATEGSTTNSECLAVVYTEAGSYNLVQLPCSSQLPYVCAASTRNEAPGIDLLYTSNNLLYTFFSGPERAGYSEAVAECSKRGQVLAVYSFDQYSPDNTAVQFLCGNVASSSDKCWMPSVPTPNDRCSAVQVTPGSEAQILLKNCTQPLPFVCKGFQPDSPPPSPENVVAPASPLSPPEEYSSPPLASPSPPAVPAYFLTSPSPSPDLEGPGLYGGLYPPSFSSETPMYPPTYGTAVDSPPPMFMNLIEAPPEAVTAAGKKRRRARKPSPSPAAPAQPTASTSDAIEAPESPATVESSPPVYGAYGVPPGVYGAYGSPPTYGRRELVDDTFLEDAIKAAEAAIGNQHDIVPRLSVSDDVNLLNSEPVGSSLYLTYVLQKDFTDFVSGSKKCQSNGGSMVSGQEIQLLISQPKFLQKLTDLLAAYAPSSRHHGLWAADSGTDCGYYLIDSAEVLWHNCQLRLPYVCKIVTKEPSTEHDINQVATYSLDRYYTAATYYQAQEYCATYDAVLAPFDLPDIANVCDKACWVAPSFAQGSRHTCTMYLSEIKGSINVKNCDQEKHPFICFAGTV